MTNTQKDKEELSWILERYSLAKERVSSIALEPFGGMFYEWIRKLVDKLVLCVRVFDQVREATYFEQPLEILMKNNQTFYQEYSEAGFATSYANTDYAKKNLPDSFGEELSFLYREYAACFQDAITGNAERLTRALELFLEIHSLLTEEEKDPKKSEYLKEIVHDHLSDYAVAEVSERFLERGLPNAVWDDRFDWSGDICQSKMFLDDTFFYRWGVPIEEERRKHILSLSGQSKIENRYEEALNVIRNDPDISEIWVRGPWYRFPFFVRSIAEDPKLVEKLRLFPASQTLVGSMCDDAGLYGPMAEAFLRQRRQDKNRYIDQRMRTRILKEIETCEQKRGLSKTEGSITIRL